MDKMLSGLSETVYQHILNQIFNGQLRPGEKIAEAKIAAEFSTSRTPIREAMRKLQSQGLVNIYPNRHAEVVNFTDKEIQDIGAIRISLDLLSIKLAALYGSRADFLRIREIAESCLNAFREGDGLARRRLDTEFHMELARVAQNELLYQMLSDLSLKIQFILLYTHFSVEDEELHLKEHLEIIDKLMCNDVHQALFLSVQHLTEFYHLDISNPISFFME